MYKRAGLALFSIGFNSAAYLTTLSSSSSSLSTSTPFAPYCSLSASPIGKPFFFQFTSRFFVTDCPLQSSNSSAILVNVCVRTEGTSVSVPAFENSCLPSDSKRPPFESPLPTTIQEGARNEGTYVKSLHRIPVHQLTCS